MVITQIIQFLVSSKRICKFLQGEELGTPVERGEADISKCKDAILVKDASFTWEEESKPILKSISFSVQKGDYTTLMGIRYLFD